MSETKTVADLRPAPYNPRKISDPKLAALAKAMARFGDLSGVVFNRRTGQLVGGHQRRRADVNFSALSAVDNYGLQLVARESLAPNVSHG